MGVSRPDGVPGLLRHHVAALDGLRGLALLLVFSYHATGAIPENSLLLWGKRIAGIGWIGVDLFFVLSGFLITGILLDTRRATNYAVSFYGRRVLRIFPLYYAVLLILALTRVWWNGLGLPLPTHLWPYFAYLNNWFDPSTPGAQLYVTGHFWSLAIEEQFYLIWPLIVWLLPMRRLADFCVVAIPAAWLFRSTVFLYTGPSDWIYKLPFARMDTLLMGALIAILIRHYPHWQQRLQPLRHILLWFPIGIISLYVFISAIRHQLRSSNSSPLMQHYGYSFIAFSFGLLLLWTYGWGASYLRTGYLPWVGKYSYGMYLYHLPLLMLLDSAFLRVGHPRNESSLTSLVYMGVGLLLTMAVAKVSYTYFESFFLGYKKHFKAEGAFISPNSERGDIISASLSS